MQAAPLVADPTSDADVQAEIQIRARFFDAGREAMGDTAGEARPEVAKDREEVGVRVALMEEHRFMKVSSQLQLFPERRALRIGRREVAEVVETAFSHRDHFRLRCHLRQLRQRVVIELCGVMRVHSSRTPESVRIPSHQVDGGARAGDRAAGNHHARHAGRLSPSDHFSAVAVEAVVREVDADVDEFVQGSLRLKQPVLSFGTVNCSGTIDRVLMLGGLYASGLLAAWLAVALPADVRAESMAELDDAAARMQYAFYTSDPRTIETLLKSIEALEVSAPLAATKSYHLAYGSWKLSQLYLDSVSEERPPSNAKALAAKAAQACVRHAKAAVQQDARMGEAYAIQAACEGFTPNARGGSAGCERGKPMRTALSVSPDNPRVKLIEALCASGRSPDPAATDRWRSVVESFEAAPPSAPGRPDWGHVEALTMLGETYLQRGDPVAARDALERALVLAPDYRQARQLLQAAAARPR